MGRRITISLLACLALMIFAGPRLCSAEDAPSDIPRKIIKKVAPLYPDAAREKNIVGTVRIQAVVSHKGMVKTTEVLGGHPLLAEAAVEAIRQWKWEPSSKDSKEIIDITFNADN